jgi:hypothetical protein
MQTDSFLRTILPDAGIELLAIALLLLACVTIQAFVLLAMQRRLWAAEPWMRVHTGFGAQLPVMFVVIVGVVMMHVAQACVWGLFFWEVVGIPSLRNAFYHSILSLTTMDDSSGVLPERWRLLGAAEGLTGWLVFSWSTGWIFMFLSTLMQLHRQHAGPVPGHLKPRD